MTITFASLFTGGGGADIGAIQAGLKPIWGVEKDLAIKAIQNNAFYQITKDLSCFTAGGDVRFYDFSRLTHPDWLHASPPCVNASTASNGTETQEDIDLAQAICRAIAILKPKYFSLENVTGYQNFSAFKLILNCLDNANYDSVAKIFDLSEYGLPQTRKRLFLVAQTHNAFSLDLPSQKPKIGWHEAIADLIPTLPECKLTKSQKERLYKLFPYDNPNLAIQNSGSRKDKNGNPTNTIRLANEPIWTIKAMSGNVRVNPHQVTLIIDGEVLRPTIQCYARWQTFPNDYQWSGDFKLDMKICGNAVPPKFFAQLIKGVINA